jgi:hypothetical protein
VGGLVQTKTEDCAIKHKRRASLSRAIKGFLNVLTAGLVVSIIGLVIVVLKARPEIPKIPGTNPDTTSELVLYELVRLDSLYEKEFLTYQGQVKAWVLSKWDYMGFGLSDDSADYVLRFGDFNVTVDNFIVYSDTTFLHMRMSPTEFRATLDALNGTNPRMKKVNRKEAP